MSIAAAPAEFTLSRVGDLWVATHVATGVASQGNDPSEAVAMAEEAVELAQQEHQPGDDAVQRDMLRQLGIDPADVADEIETPDGMP